MSAARSAAVCVPCAFCCSATEGGFVSAVGGVVGVLPEPVFLIVDILNPLTTRRGTPQSIASSQDPPCGRAHPPSPPALRLRDRGAARARPARGRPRSQLPDFSRR